jgi:hypothetical protein
MSNYRLSLGDISFEKQGIPTMEIVVVNEDSPEVRTIGGYLTPFRGYRFQVSGDKNGSGDYGSSPVIAFFKDCMPTDNKYVWLKGQIMLALVQYANNAYGQRISAGNPIRIPFFNIGEDSSRMNTFIEESIKWIYR